MVDIDRVHFRKRHTGLSPISIEDSLSGIDSEVDKIVYRMFRKYWNGDHTVSSLHNMRVQLRKNIQNQLDGFWSGSSAYQIMTQGGFIVDAKTGKKKLTELGKMFMASFDE